MRPSGTLDVLTVQHSALLFELIDIGHINSVVLHAQPDGICRSWQLLPLSLDATENLVEASLGEPVVRQVDLGGQTCGWQLVEPLS